MLRGGYVNEIQELKRQGLSISQISVLSGYDRKTIRKYLEHPQAKTALERANTEFLTSDNCCHHCGSRNVFRIEERIIAQSAEAATDH